MRFVWSPRDPSFCSGQTSKQASLGENIYVGKQIHDVVDRLGQRGDNGTSFFPRGDLDTSPLGWKAWPYKAVPHHLSHHVQPRTICVFTTARGGHHNLCHAKVKFCDDVNAAAISVKANNERKPRRNSQLTFRYGDDSRECLGYVWPQWAGSTFLAKRREFPGFAVDENDSCGVRWQKGGWTCMLNVIFLYIK